MAAAAAGSLKEKHMMNYLTTNRTLYQPNQEQVARSTYITEMDSDGWMNAVPADAKAALVMFSLFERSMSKACKVVTVGM